MQSADHNKKQSAPAPLSTHSKRAFPGVWKEEGQERRRKRRVVWGGGGLTKKRHALPNPPGKMMLLLGAPDLISRARETKRECRGAPGRANLSLSLFLSSRPTLSLPRVPYALPIVSSHNKLIPSPRLGTCPAAKQTVSLGRPATRYTQTVSRSDSETEYVCAYIPREFACAPTSMTASTGP